MEDGHDDNFSFFLRRPSVYDMNNKVMLTAILSLMIVVVLVVTLHIYARCVLGRQARRRAALRGLSLRVARLHSMIEQPKRTGLDPTVIASLPFFKYKGDRDGHEADPVRPECSVCLSLLEDEEIARLLPNCNHVFHAECIDKWLGSHTTCPVCRAEVKPRLQPEPREPPSLVPVQPHQLNSMDSNSNCMEGTSEDSARALINKSTGGSSSRLNSFRRMLTRERSSQRLGQTRNLDDDEEDPESLRHDQ